MFLPTTKVTIFFTLQTCNYKIVSYFCSSIIQELMKGFFTIVGYLKPYKKYAALNIILNTLAAVFSLFSLTMVIPFLDMLFDTGANIVEDPGPLRPTIDSLVGNFNYLVYTITITHGKINALLFISGAVVLFFFLKNLFSYLASYFMAPISNGAVRDFQEKIYNKILILPLRYFTEARKGDILARFTSDVQEIKNSISGSLDMLFKDPIQIICFMAYLIYTSPKLTLVVLVVLPLIAGLIGRIGKSLKSSSSQGQAIIGEMLSVMEETLSGLRIVKAFNAEQKMKERFNRINTNSYRVNNRVYRKYNLPSPLSEFLGVAVLVFILIYGGYLVITGQNTFTSAQFIGYLTVFSQILNPAKQLARTVNTIQKGLASLDRVNVILNETMNVPEIENPVRITDFKNCIEFRNVSFKYGEKYVLKDINLKIEKGRTVALVGQSGSGKSTMVDLLPRFWDVQQGEILIDGVNIKNYKLYDLRNLMGNVNQESILFNDTIRNNITFGVESASDSQVEAAAKVANALEFITENEFNIERFYKKEYD